MSEVVRTIRLYGPLGARFGRVHRLAVLSAREAGHALAQIVPGFAQYLTDSADRGLRYAVFLGRRNIGEDLLDLPAGGDEIRIAPIVQGAKSGLFQTILGAALIAFAFWNPAGLASTTYLIGSASTAAAGGIAMTVGGVALAVGAALALGGISQMITGSSKRKSATKESYGLSGPVNTTGQGNPVPLFYGRMIIGGQIISSGIYSEDRS